jgi:hypothetical protein
MLRVSENPSKGPEHNPLIRPGFLCGHRLKGDGDTPFAVPTADQKFRSYKQITSRRANSAGELHPSVHRPQITPPQKIHPSSGRRDLS